MASAIHHVAGKASFYGTVLPILTWKGDNLTIHRALNDAKPGDVLVINGNSETNRADFGDLLGEVCLTRKVAAVVIDGAVRDVEELTAMWLRTYSCKSQVKRQGGGTVLRPLRAVLAVVLENAR